MTLGRFQSSIVAAFAATIAGMALASPPASASGSYTNSTPITIVDNAVAAPYSSDITVQGQSGRLTGVSVTLHGFSHPKPYDVDILLLSPTGDRSIVMSDVCGTLASNRTWHFTETAAARMPIDTSTDCNQPSYRPSDDLGGVDAWPGGPLGPHTASFDRFIGGHPNGTWRLAVVDDLPPYAGKIEGGWTLHLETAVPRTLIPGGLVASLADPYPDTRTVAGRSGVIEDLDVSLSGVFHERPDDLELLLVGPRGQKVTLMSDACGAEAARGSDWGWNDQAPTAMSDGGPCPTTGYKPVDYEPGDELQPPAPGGPYESTMAAFNGTDPNGEWRLYARDDLPNDADGLFVEQFVVTIATRPKAKVGFATGAVDVAEGEDRAVRLTRSGPAAGLGPATVTVTSSPRSATSGSDYRAVSTTVAFTRGETEKTVPVEALIDSLAEGSESFALSIDEPTGDAELGTVPTTVVTIGDRGGAAADDRVPPPHAGGEAAVDRTAPVIGGLTLAPARFGVARRARRGTTIRYTLSEPAAVTLRFERSVAGRRVGRSCRPVGARSRAGRACRRYVPTGTLRRAGVSGPNRVAFSGRIDRRAMRRGAYRLTVSAVDAAGNRSSAPSRRFRIVG